jgi:hypothetical protein
MERRQLGQSGLADEARSLLIDLTITRPWRPGPWLCPYGSHAGVSIVEDGPSQMRLEDIAMMGAVHGSVVLHPATPTRPAELVVAMGRPSRRLLPAHPAGVSRR